MKTRVILSTLASTIAMIFFAGVGLAETPDLPDQAPPFAAGQVAVYAQPGQLPGLTVAKYLPHSGISVVKAETGRERGLVQKLREKGFKAGLNLMAHASILPNDPYYSLYQWHFENIQAGQAWEVQTGVGVIVAVLDTGLAAGGPDGIGCVVEETDIVNGDSDPADGDGHGTHVSGTIAQATNNGVGVAGVAYGACIMPVKVLDDSGSGTFADIAEGIHYAVDHGASVINMSLGTNARYAITNDPVMDPALDYAYEQSVTVVCASGNDASRKNVSYPAIYSTTIAVGATDYANQVTKYSNKGIGLDLVAPGGNLSADLNYDGYPDGVLQETQIDGSWGYYFFSGTSMASPHVAAVAALLIAQDPTLTPEDIKQKLTSSTLDLGAAGYDSTSGYGLVQAYDALAGAVPPEPCTDCDEDGYSEAAGDCNDHDASIHPGVAEVCDGIDNNCNSEIDEGCSGACTDNDGDGWCVEDGDCNDNDPTIYPGHPDKVGRWGNDGVDNDCNGTIDG